MEEIKIENLPPVNFNPDGAGLPPTDDQFDPERLRLSQNFVDRIGVKKVLSTVPIRKPHRQNFVRVHPDWRFETMLLRIKEDQEIYIVEQSVWEALSNELAPVTLVSTMNRQGTFFLWPIRLPQADGRHDEWSRSAFVAAELAMDRWVRVVANMDLGAYEVFQATAAIPEPDWPEIAFDQLLKIAFKARVIQTSDHPVIQKLQGIR